MLTQHQLSTTPTIVLGHKHAGFPRDLGNPTVGKQYCHNGRMTLPPERLPQIQSTVMP